MKVKDLMTADVETIFDDEELDLAETIMTISRIRHLPVTDRNDRLVGLITQKDLLRYSSKAEDPDGKLMAADIMLSKVASVSPSTPIKMAARLLVENKYGCLPVVEGDRVIGIITESDFVEFVADNVEKFDGD